MQTKTVQQTEIDMPKKTSECTSMSIERVKTILYQFSKETVSILYWIGTWSLIMPAENDKLTTAWMCFSCGIVGVVMFMVLEDF